MQKDAKHHAVVYLILAALYLYVWLDGRRK